MATHSHRRADTQDFEETIMPRKTVSIIMGSDSDWPIMEACYQQLQAFDVPAEVEVISAHRAPDRLRDYVVGAKDRGIGVFITAAGMAAALPGAVASFTTLPVIGVPLSASGLQGVDSLLSIVQMPPGVPVATVAIGKPGAKNAALLAIQILALADATLASALEVHKTDQAKAVLAKSDALKEKLNSARSDTNT
jgi:phosphoribosylaminoimidazole carboxylase PurE protein